jgi:hypothetical protein
MSIESCKSKFSPTPTRRRRPESTSRSAGLDSTALASSAPLRTTRKRKVRAVSVRERVVTAREKAGTANRKAAAAKVSPSAQRNRAQLPLGGGHSAIHADARESMTLKDGSTIPVTAHVKKPESTQKRLAQLEKRLTANQIDADDEDSEEDGEDLELFVGGMAPKSVQIAAARKKLKALEAAGTKRKRANTATVFDRLGTSEDDIPVKARKSTEAELNTELGMDTDSE